MIERLKGHIFSVHNAPGRISRFVVWAQKRFGEAPENAAPGGLPVMEDPPSHVGVLSGKTDTKSRVWAFDSTILQGGVRYHPLRPGNLQYIRVWKPPHWRTLSDEDYERAFRALRGHWGERYNFLLWRRLKGRKQCAQLVQAYLNVLTQPYGYWAGRWENVISPLDVVYYLRGNEVRIEDPFSQQGLVECAGC